MHGHSAEGAQVDGKTSTPFRSAVSFARLGQYGRNGDLIFLV
jgi:hypothetical protein